MSDEKPDQPSAPVTADDLIRRVEKLIQDGSPTPESAAESTLRIMPLTVPAPPPVPPETPAVPEMGTPLPEMPSLAVSSVMSPDVPSFEAPVAPDVPPAVPAMPQFEAPAPPEAPRIEAPVPADAFQFEPPVVPDVPTPEVPDVPTPVAPTLEAPDVPAPDVPAPEVPDLAVPTVAVPDVPTPEVPEIVAPAVGAPVVSAAEVPDIVAPKAELPEVPQPEVPAVPAAEVPEVPQPEVPEVPAAVAEVPVPPEPPAPASTMSPDLANLLAAVYDKDPKPEAPAPVAPVVAPVVPPVAVATEAGPEPVAAGEDDLRAERERRLGTVTPVSDDAEVPPLVRPDNDRFVGGFGLFWLRLVVAALLGARAIQMMMHPHATADWLATYSVPDPLIVTWSAAGVMLLTALMLVIGFGTRLFAVIVALYAIAFLVFVRWGAFNVFTSAPEGGFFGESELLLAAIGVTLAFLGSGGWGIDAARRLTKAKRKLYN